MHETMTSEQNIMPLVNEICEFSVFGSVLIVYFLVNTVELGQVPSIPPLISAGYLRNTDGETLLIVGARCGHEAVVDRFRNEIEVDEVRIFGDF